MKKLRIAGLASILALSVGLAACGNDSKEGKTIGDEVDYKITGIEPGAGIMTATNKALEEYDNLKDYKLVESSSAAMAAELDKAIKNEDPIIVTGWTPHWMFAKYDLKYLKDPKGVYGDAEKIETFARKGLKEDQPSAYTVLDQFSWTNDDIGEVMVDIQEGTDPAEAADKWVKDNKDKVDEWTKGADKVSGEEITLSYVAWDSEIASTNVVAKTLESIGYKVKLVQLDAGPMFTAVAEGNADATVSGWLPLTHKDYLDKYGDKMDRLGPNLEGAKTGLVVPSYVEADSIEDLK
ncbi:glycine/betaine ABC transporter [Rossellomorea marisflavi]|jgi:glycine betaine/proline transport system substrate-binding protein|uniref:Glycine/betaine ABC transporter n=1 Tax=Rossellomorea marisflavi TaxID=189381 RepID=A0A5D4RDP9_9BACI|nr:glycine betaine ABC transporter substrate-binding protein [Rossellomorea marisflavi]VXB72432.1 L-proline betaine and betonicine ABC transporter ABC transporter (glycine betaine-binding lipoprotein) [Bacillus sp. 349Y]MDW4528891.1 glycine betaine ABC transporter substrate-binding protein [Rossellomorea marisflavi]TYS49525.1 glycine/betaine ABC transporter [Rossellomorea marisflavi]UKS65554.1 glycine/betaine ABC transporter [Rossellomorea marisflavi]WJV18738.1 glycine betaine ABC transporter 